MITAIISSRLTVHKALHGHGREHYTGRQYSDHGKYLRKIQVEDSVRLCVDRPCSLLGVLGYHPVLLLNWSAIAM
jgi:hypothetical protein